MPTRSIKTTRKQAIEYVTPVDLRPADALVVTTAIYLIIRVFARAMSRRDLSNQLITTVVELTASRFREVPVTRLIGFPCSYEGFFNAECVSSFLGGPLSDGGVG